MDKMKVVRVGIVDEHDNPQGWVFDNSGNYVTAAINIEDNWKDIYGMRANVLQVEDGLMVDVFNMPTTRVLYGGYTVAELKDIYNEHEIWKRSLYEL